MRLMNLMVLNPSASKSACRLQEGDSANRKEVVKCRNRWLLRQQGVTDGFPASSVVVLVVRLKPSPGAQAGRSRSLDWPSG